MGDKTSMMMVIPRYSVSSQNNVFSKIIMPPVGPISVISQLAKNPKFDVYAIDENNYKGPKDSAGMPDHKMLQKIKPADIAMFYGGMSNSVPRLFSVAQQYQNFGAVTIAGGSHVDALPNEALNSGVDIVVHGEGEKTIQELVDTIINNGEIRKGYKKNLKNVVGISFLDYNKKYVFTGKREPIMDLDGLEDTDLSLLKFKEKKLNVIPINKGRGCNFKCEFCVVNKQYGKYKTSSIEKAMRQIKQYSKEGYRKFFFTDDNFAQNMTETIELCKEIGDYKRNARKKIELTVQVRSEVAESEELMEAMWYAGVRTIAIGYESPINEELKAMNKGVTVEKLVERSRKLSRRGFYIHGMFIFGYPTFKDSQFKSNLTLGEKAKKYERFFKDARIDTIQICNAAPLPGSELREKLAAEGRILPLKEVGWDKYDGLFLCYDPRPEGVNPIELQNLPKILMRKKYIGSLFNKRINYGNWMNWAYNGTVGFPIEFGESYIKNFVHNLAKKRSERNRTHKSLFPARNIFYESLVDAWYSIRRRWRNLFVKTYGGEIFENWFVFYKNCDYQAILKRLYTQSNKTPRIL